MRGAPHGVRACARSQVIPAAKCGEEILMLQFTRDRGGIEYECPYMYALLGKAEGFYFFGGTLAEEL